MPLTPGGKIDRGALPAPDGLRPEQEKGFVAPRTPIEVTIAKIWARVMRLERVGVHDDFFALGGHSLLATRICSRIRDAFHIEVPLHVIFDRPSVAGLSAWVASLTRPISERCEGDLDAPIPIARRDRPLPASSSQQQLWLVNRLDPDSAAYNLPTAYRIEGRIDVTALEQAINEIVRRHEVLRTTFSLTDDGLIQVIAPDLFVPLALTDLEGTHAGAPDSSALRTAIKDNDRPFDLSSGPLLRAQLLRLRQEEHILLLTFHHIITDGWSMAVLERELAELYAAYSLGRPARLPELAVQYADFAVWERHWLEGEVLARQLSYWKEQLEGAPEIALLTGHPRPAQLPADADRQMLAFPEELCSALRELSHQEGATLFMTLLAAFEALLYCQSGQTDIVVGTPAANRQRAGIEGMIGFFVNTLVLRTDLTPGTSGVLTFRELLARVKDVCLGAFAHQQLPFENLVTSMRTQRDPSRNPLFQVMFVMQNEPLARLDLVGLSVKPLDLPPSTARFDLECQLWEEGDSIRGALIYNRHLFDAGTMTRLAANYQELLEIVMINPDRCLSDLRTSTWTNLEQRPVGGAPERSVQPNGPTVIDLFEMQAALSPETVACAMNGQQLKYGELNAQANQVARFLQARGIGPEALVGLCCERSLQAMVGLLGILKAGAACVPLDPNYPQARLAFMIEDSSVALLLTQEDLIDRLPPNAGPTICLDSESQVIAQRECKNPTRSAAPTNLAYVLYTSGSTGKPKGVAMEHRSLHNLIRWQLQDSRGFRADPNPSVHIDELRCLVSRDLIDPMCGWDTRPDP